MASLAVQFTHPVITVSSNLAFTDAKMVEFADLLIDTYGGGLTRSEAVQIFADSMVQSAKDAYRKMKYDADVALVAEEEIDI